MVVVSVFDTKSYDREYLEKAGKADQISWRFHDFRLSAESVPVAQGAQAICVFVNDHVDRACLLALAALNIRLVLLRCAGFNNVDLEAADELGIRVVRVPAYSPHSVAEHTIGLLLTLNRKIHRAYNRVREMNFSLGGLVGFDLFGKTVGVVGTGKIGRIAAQLFHGFGMKVLVCDPLPDRSWAETIDARYVSFEALLEASDIVSLHAPLLPDTMGMLNDSTIALTKKGVFIVNTSRGKLIDSGALIQSLKSGHVGGVALDVYEEEEGVFFEDLSGEVLADDELARLLSFPNVLITSHQAFLTREALSEIARVTTENLLLFENGEPFLEGTLVEKNGSSTK